VSSYTSIKIPLISKQKRLGRPKSNIFEEYMMIGL
jgi:hypothetical protein